MQQSASSISSSLTANQRRPWGDNLVLRDRPDEHLVGCVNIAGLPEKASGMKNYVLLFSINVASKN